MSCLIISAFSEHIALFVRAQFQSYFQNVTGILHMSTAIIIYENAPRVGLCYCTLVLPYFSHCSMYVNVFQNLNAFYRFLDKRWIISYKRLHWYKVCTKIVNRFGSTQHSDFLNWQLASSCLTTLLHLLHMYEYLLQYWAIFN